MPDAASIFFDASQPAVCEFHSQTAKLNEVEPNMPNSPEVSRIPVICHLLFAIPNLYSSLLVCYLLLAIPNFSSKRIVLAASVVCRIPVRGPLSLMACHLLFAIPNLYSSLLVCYLLLAIPNFSSKRIVLAAYEVCPRR